MITLLAMAWFISAPIWTPGAFIAYALGKKDCSMQFLILFIVAETMTITLDMFLGAVTNAAKPGMLETVVVAWLFSVPLWMPIVFAGYAFGRTQFTIALLLGLTAAEGASLSLVFLMAGAFGRCCSG